MLIDNFCPNDCKYLNINEHNQSKFFKVTHNIMQHSCLKYHIRLFHGDAHPFIYRCENCRKEVIQNETFYE